MTMTALPKADSYVIGSAPCERAPGGRVFFIGAAHWLCTYCGQPVSDHDVTPEEL